MSKPRIAVAEPLTIADVGGDQPRVDSRLMAAQLDNQHRSVIGLVDTHKDYFAALGVVRFQTAKPRAGSNGGRPERYAMLTEDQCYLLLSYSRNTARVRALKLNLVRAFGEARRARDTWKAEYLPTYRTLHDTAAALADGSPNERFVHMNINRAINRAVGIEAGQRGRLSLPERSLLVCAQAAAAQAMQGAADHHEGYRRAADVLVTLRALVAGPQSQNVTQGALAVRGRE